MAKDVSRIQMGQSTFILAMDSDWNNRVFHQSPHAGHLKVKMYHNRSRGFEPGMERSIQTS